MYQFKYFVSLVLMVFCIAAIADTQKSQCHENFTNKEWSKARVSCELELANNQLANKSITLLNKIAEIYSRLENPEKELEYLNLIKNHPDFPNDLEQQYDWNRSMGMMAFYKTDHAKALTYFKKDLEIATILDNAELKSKSHNDLGILYSIIGKYSQALDNYKNSVELKLELNDYYAAANTYSNIGSLLLELEKPIDSIDYLLLAIKYYEIVDNEKSKNMITHVHEELSMAYLATNQREKAQHYIAQILSSSKIRTTNEEQSNASLALAKYYNEEGKPEIASLLLSQAIFDEKPMYFLEISLELAKIELELKNISKAKQVATKGLAIANQKKDVFYQFNFNQVLSRAYESESPDLALDYLKAYQAFREEFLKKKYDSKVDTIEFQIKKHKFEKDILAEKLTNSEKEKRISQLTIWILMGSLLLLTTLVAWAWYIHKKRIEKTKFLEQIQYHQNQLILLNAAKEEQVEDQKVTKTITKQDFKEALIKAMVEAVDIWNRHTGKNRIDLAEKSKVWTVTIDNGTLRTRSMDKYMSLKNIPANPRWRKVVRTCHFILSDSSLNGSDRELLNGNLNKVMHVIKAL